jgi:hypothetical protein
MRVSVTLKNEASGESEEVSGTLKDDEVQTLEEFVRYAEDLGNTTYMREGPAAALEVRFDKGKEPKVTPTLPGADVADAFVHRLRPFILESEPTSYPRVSGMIARSLDHPLMRQFLRAHSDQWTGKTIRSQMHVSDNFGLLNSDESLMRYLNAYEYHRDRDKQERFEGPRGLLSDDGLRAFYLMLLTSKAKAVLRLSFVCNVILQKRSSVRLQWRS